MDYKLLAALLSTENAEDEASIYSHTSDAVAILEPGADRSFIDRIVPVIKSIIRSSGAPIYVAGGIKRFEDVKKLIYAGAHICFADLSYLENEDVYKEACERFGKEKLGIIIDAKKNDDGLVTFSYLKKLSESGISNVLVLNAAEDTFANDITEEASGVKSDLPVIFTVLDSEDTTEMIYDIKKSDATDVFIINTSGKPDIMSLKNKLKENGITVKSLESAISFSDFKKDGNGLIPCIVQDYKTNDVLMMAYMNEEAFNKTIETGLMTYYSRSRSSLWVKGETSGHFQYVKSLDIDCDRDTLLAKVFQVGAACHTGNRSCFYTPLAKSADKKKSPLTVLNDVYDVIIDRKNNPKEGSYTNYLFDKGIDKMLKKVGEECTEVVIAAKNPDSEEIKYEIADLLYHLMVVMAERDVTWEDITRELADRE